MSINKEIWKMRARLTAIILLAAIIGGTFTYSYIKGKEWYDWMRVGYIYASNSTSSPELAKADSAGEVKEDLYKSDGEAPITSPYDTLLEKYFGDESKLAYSIMMAESSGNPLTIGDKHLKKPSIGLFQINQLWHPYSTEQLQDAEFNIRSAKEIRDSGGWERWTTFRTGANLKFL